MPASALLSRQPFGHQAISGIDLVVVMPAEPGHVHDVVINVVAGARARGWRVRIVPLSELVAEHPTAQGAGCVYKPFTPRR